MVARLIAWLLPWRRSRSIPTPDGIGEFAGIPSSMLPPDRERRRR